MDKRNTKKLRALTEKEDAGMKVKRTQNIESEAGAVGETRWKDLESICPTTIVSGLVRS